MWERNWKMWIQFSKTIKDKYVKTHLTFIPRDFIQFCLLHELPSIFSFGLFFSRFFNAILAFRISFRVSIYRSLISFTISRLPHLVLHVILISSFITDVIAPPLRGIQALQCVSFLRGERFRGRFAKHMDVAVVKQDDYYISFFYQFPA